MLGLGVVSCYYLTYKPPHHDLWSHKPWSIAPEEAVARDEVAQQGIEQKQACNEAEDVQCAQSRAISVRFRSLSTCCSIGLRLSAFSFSQTSIRRRCHVESRGPIQWDDLSIFRARACLLDLCRPYVIREVADGKLTIEYHSHWVPTSKACRSRRWTGTK